MDEIGCIDAWKLSGDKPNINNVEGCTWRNLRGMPLFLSSPLRGQVFPGVLAKRQTTHM